MTPGHASEEDKVITDSAAPILGAQRQPPHLR